MVYSSVVCCSTIILIRCVCDTTCSVIISTSTTHLTGDLGTGIGQSFLLSCTGHCPVERGSFQGHARPRLVAAVAVSRQQGENISATAIRS